MKNLIVYYSFTGKTELVAQTIAKELKADLRKVEDLKERSILKAYLWGSFEALFGKCGRIKQIDFSLEGYDKVFIGTPVWAGRSVPAINTFVDKTDFSGKNVSIFVTMGGNNEGKSIKILHDKIIKKGGKMDNTFSIKTGRASDEDIVNQVTKSTFS
jgi:flavodoxin